MADRRGSQAYLIGNTFLENRAENVNTPWAGAGGAVSLWSIAATVKENQFVGNVAHSVYSAPVGGALYANTDLPVSHRKYSKVTLSQNHFADNVVSGGSDGRGGAIRMTNVPARIENNTIVRNTVENGRGGGIAFRDPLPSGLLQELVNNTICYNTARYGGGVSLRGNDTSVVVLNSILWGNTATRGRQKRG